MFNMRHRYQRCTAILLSVLLPCLCSCAPTPQAQESRIQPVSTAVSAPDRILLEAALPSGMQVVIDAPVHLTAKTFSAINCTERDFTLAEIRRVYSALCGNAQPYQWAETQENLITYIGYCQSLLALAEGSIDDELLAYERAYLNDARKKIPSTPTEKQPADWNKLFTYPDGSLQADLGKEWDAYFQVLTEPYSLIYFKNYGLPSITGDVVDPQPTITEDEALACAQAVLDTIGIAEGFVPIRIRSERINHSFYEGYLPAEMKSSGYRLLYTRAVNGLPQLDNDRITLGTARMNAPDHHQEYIEFVIDETGVLQFTWQSPASIEVTGNALRLIDLETAQQLALERWAQTYRLDDVAGVPTEQVMLQIDRIALGYICCMGRNLSTAVIPAWEFYGTISVQTPNGVLYFDEELQLWQAEARDNTSLCSVSAVDGSIIDRIGRYSLG